VSGSALLSAAAVSVFYGRVEAVHGVSLRVDAGQIVTVIGANGAGKTTLLSALMGLLPVRGDVSYLGQQLEDEPPESRVARGLALVPERRELFGDMSVADNLLLGAFHRRRDLQVALDLETVYGRFPKLRDRRGQLAATLSGGERQMLALGRALMSKPRLLMLDEPSLGLAPLVVRDIFRIIQDLKQAGVSILLIEQNARAALEVADYAYVLEAGSVAMEGPATELARDSRVAETYLGLAAKERRSGPSAR
jgi:branched-chain amino acid transport system ATP-binding protein